MVVEQEKVQKQLENISVRLIDIENKKEPVVAFRASAVKDSGGGSGERVSKNPGIYILLSNASDGLHLAIVPKSLIV